MILTESDRSNKKTVHTLAHPCCCCLLVPFWLLLRPAVPNCSCWCPSFQIFSVETAYSLAYKLNVPYEFLDLRIAAGYPWVRQNHLKVGQSRSAFVHRCSVMQITIVRIIIQFFSNEVEWGKIENRTDLSLWLQMKHWNQLK